MNSPPSTHKLSTCFWIVFGDKFDAAICSVQIPAVVFDSMDRRGGSAVYFSVLAVICFHFMLQLITILNRCHRFPGFVYQQARFSSDHQSIEIAVRPRKGSKAVCSRCHKLAPGYDQLTERRFEFIPFWGFLVFLLYSMRRVDCRRCQAVVVEEAPWGDGKRTLTKAYMLFLARWARQLSWKETAESFRTSWDKVFDAVEHVVTGAWSTGCSARSTPLESTKSNTPEVTNISPSSTRSIWA